MASSISRSGSRAIISSTYKIDEKSQENKATEIAVQILLQNGIGVRAENLTLDHFLQAETIICAPGSAYHVVTDGLMIARFRAGKDIITGTSAQGTPLYVVSETARHALHQTIGKRIDLLPPIDRLTPLSISSKNLFSFTDKMNDPEKINIKISVLDEIERSLVEPLEGQRKDCQACVML